MRGWRTSTCSKASRAVGLGYQTSGNIDHILLYIDKWGIQICLQHHFERYMNNKLWRLGSLTPVQGLNRNAPNQCLYAPGILPPYPWSLPWCPMSMPSSLTIALMPLVIALVPLSQCLKAPGHCYDAPGHCPHAPGYCIDDPNSQCLNAPGHCYDAPDYKPFWGTVDTPVLH